LKTLNSIKDLASVPGPIFLAIGVFDGVHLGHRAVIERTLKDAQNVNGTAVVVTFDPHPLRILRPGNAPRLLTSTPHKIRLLKELGISHTLVLKFDEAFAATDPEYFILTLHHESQTLREICVGHEWSFGHNRAGNLQLLARMGDRLGFDEVGVHAVKIDDQIVSSTAIRCAVESGDLNTAARFLGREYTVLGTVVEGAHLGTQLGFPTANLRAHNEQFPPNGVYAVTARFGENTHKGVANIGVRPTLENQTGERLLEVHLFDFNANIYGEEVEVSFGRFIRSEEKFASLDELKAQIAKDAAIARIE
jgi:riboflavin kinase/FMN adenylyltransferase